MAFEDGIYETQTLQIASDIMTNPYALLIFVGVVFVFMVIMVFALVPSMWTRDYMSGTLSRFRGAPKW